MHLYIYVKPHIYIWKGTIPKALTIDYRRCSLSIICISVLVFLLATTMCYFCDQNKQNRIKNKI